MKLSDLWRAFSPQAHSQQQQSPQPPSLQPQASTSPGAPESKNRLYLGLAALGLILYAYFISQTCEVNAIPTSLFRWLLAAWGRGPDDAHGYFVPFVSGGLAYWLWKHRLQNVPLSSSKGGLPVLVFAVLLYWIGVKAANPRIVAASLVVLIFGLVLYLAGWAWARHLWFPCAFLVFMIPLNFLEPILSFPLRMFVAKFSTQILNFFGMEVVQDGTAIKSAVTPPRFEPLDVAAPCSGIRSLVALMALTSIYGYMTMDRWWKKWVLFMSSIPLAVIGNLARITSITFVAQGFGQDLAMQLFHDYSGFIVFSLAILCMIGLGTLLNLHYRELISHWLEEETPLTAGGHRRHG